MAGATASLPCLSFSFNSKDYLIIAKLIFALRLTCSKGCSDLLTNDAAATQSRGRLSVSYCNPAGYENTIIMFTRTGMVIRYLFDFFLDMWAFFLRLLSGYGLTDCFHPLGCRFLDFRVL